MSNYLWAIFASDCNYDFLKPCIQRKDESKQEIKKIFTTVIRADQQMGITCFLVIVLNFG